MVHAGYTKKDIAGMTAREQLDALHASTKEFMKNQYQTLNRSLIPQLAQNGLKLVRHHEDLTPKQAKYVDKYFEKDVYPYSHLWRWTRPDHSRWCAINH